MLDDDLIAAQKLKRDQGQRGNCKFYSVTHSVAALVTAQNHLEVAIYRREIENT